MENTQQKEVLDLIPGQGKKTVFHIQKKKGKEQIVMLAISDVWMAAAAEAADVDIIRLFSFNGANDLEIMQNTPLLIKQMRGVAPNIVINPFMWPAAIAESDQAAIRWGVTLMSAGADIVLALAITPKRMQAMAEQGIPVFGHVGLTPFWYTQWRGGYVSVGKTADDALSIYQNAHDLQEAGAAMLTIEMTPREVTAEIAKRLRIPVISIGAGAGADGAELVYADLLGIDPRPIPRHSKQYRRFFDEAVGAFKEFGNDVKDRTYPDPEQHSRSMKKEEYERFLNKLEHVKH